MAESDLELLEQYARHNSEEAFAMLVSRRLGMVYSAALRQVNSPQLAEEVAQSVFADLARKALKLKPGTLLTAWLYQVTRRTAIDVVRKESSRQARERMAAEMTDMKADSAEWGQLRPLLDEAMEALEEADRNALLLRYFENRSLREVGQTLGTTEDTAQKRVSRAVERLRGLLAKRGLAIGAGSLVAVLSANALQAAPAGLQLTISAAAVLSGVAIHSTQLPLEPSKP
jgi:RNA polymerase sigma factor (sigma-70 family)